MMNIDRVIGALGRISELAQIRADKAEADQTDRRRCGNCVDWMKSRECPREKPSRTGYSQGPSSEAPACPQFRLLPWVVELKAKRLAAVEARLAALEQADAR